MSHDHHSMTTSDPHSGHHHPTTAGHDHGGSGGDGSMHMMVSSECLEYIEESDPASGSNHLPVLQEREWSDPLPSWWGERKAAHLAFPSVLNGKTTYVSPFSCIAV